MITQQKIKTVLDELQENGAADISVFGGRVQAKYFPQDAKLTLTTKIYDGVNFFPKSVRDCLKKEPPMPPADIQTYTTLEEESFQAFLHYLGSVERVDAEKLRKLLEEFGWIAEEWRYYLDDCDKKDLIHVLQ